MTGMLASVTSSAEAEIVLNEMVEVIDLKNPLKGALGALNKDIVIDVVNLVNKRATTSATIGDVNQCDPELLEKIQQMAATGVDIVKVGLFSSTPNQYFINTIYKACEQGISVVIVLFAEDYSGIESISELLNLNIKGIMLDTKNKNGRRLRDILSDETLKEFIRAARNNQLLTGIAGSLKYDDIGVLLSLESDYLGFRGALCSEGDRVNQLDKLKLKKIRNAIPRSEIINYDLIKDDKEELKNGTVA